MRATKIGALLLCLLLLAGCSGIGAEAEPAETSGLASSVVRERKTNYDVQVMEEGVLEHTAELSMEPSYRLLRTVTSGSVELDMIRILVSRDDIVQEGDTIAILQGKGSLSDAAQKELEIRSLKAGIEEQKAYYDGLIRDEENRSYETESGEKISALRVESLKNDKALYLLSAERQLAAQEQLLAALQAATAEIEIKAPTGGKVRSVSTRYKEGDTVPAGTELCSIYGANSLVLVGTSNSGHFTYGKTVALTIGKGEKMKNYTGKVVSSPEVLGSASSGGQIVVRIDGDLSDSKSTQCTAVVTRHLLENVLVLPKSAVSADEGKYYVQVLEGDSPRTRCVVRGPVIGTQTVILQGINEGDSVVLRYYNS